MFFIKNKYKIILNEENNLFYNIFIVLFSYSFLLFGAWNDKILGLHPNNVTFFMEYFLAIFLGFELILRLILKDDRNFWFYTFLLIDLFSILTVVPGILYVSFLRFGRLFINGLKIVKILDNFAVKNSNPYQMLYIYPLVIPLIAAFLYAVEKNASNVNVKNYFDALYMAFSYSMTIGLSSHHPVTIIGNIICGMLLLIGFMIVAVMGNTISNRYQKKN